MANTLANLARMYTETTGTGTLTLLNAVPGFNTFEDEGVPDGATITYAIYCGPHREIGAGVWTESTKTLTRATVYSSTNGGSRINLTGRSEVFITVAKEDFATFGGGAGISDGDYGDIVVSGGGTVLSIDSGVATTFGRSLMDDADAATARTTLGLGTAATQNTGTSGATIPLLNAGNTWSSQQIIEWTASPFGNGLVVQATEDSGGAGPGVLTRRISASPAAFDQLGFFQFQGRDSAANNQIYASLSAEIVDPTSGSEDGGFSLNTVQAGAVTAVMGVRLGAFVGSPTGGDQGVGTLNAVTLYENGTSLASKYQGLDSELTAIAGLTSAADRLPYFTGSGTAALATFTAAGRALLDDADTTAQRTTLGLGTAAVANTGTSGNTLPFLDGANTWSNSQTITGASLSVTLDTAFGAPITCTSNDTGASRGPNFLFRRTSTSPADNDDGGAFLFQANDSTPTLQTYATIGLRSTAVAAGAFSGRIRFQTSQSAAFAERGYFGAGLVVGSPTSGDLGTGTFNAVTLYENGTSLAAKYQPLDADLTTIAGLADPNADRILFWDDSAGAYAYLTAGTGLTITGTTITASGATVADGDYGDVTVSSSGTVWTIDNDAVTYAKMQNTGAGNVVLTRANSAAGDIGETALAASQLLGRGSTGDVAAITIGSGLSMSGTTLSASGSGGLSRGQVVALASLTALT